MAMATLNDEDKRAHYDRYGVDENGGGGAPGGGGGGVRYAHNARYETEISPEEIFNMFFGGGGAPFGAQPFGRQTAFHVHRRGGMAGAAAAAARRAAEQPPDPAARVMQLFQLLPLLLLFVFFLLSFSGGGEPEHRLQQVEPYAVLRRTAGLNGLAPNLPYYVRRDFDARVRGRHQLYAVREAAARPAPRARA